MLFFRLLPAAVTHYNAGIPLFVGSHCTPTFALESGPGRAVVASKDEGHYENGKWIAGRRLNGDEGGRGLPGNGVIGMLRVKLFRME